MTAKEIESKATELALPLIKELGLIHVDTEFVSEDGLYYLRIFIDKPGGVTIDDCVDLTRPMNELLDKKPFIKEAYTFEVSSPGIDRPLKTTADLIRCNGRKVLVKLYAPLDGKKEFEGILSGHDGESITIEDEGETFKIPREGIAIIKQTIDF